jgi:integrase
VLVVQQQGSREGERNNEELPKGTINKIWRLARAAVFAPEVLAMPLAETPYDLRHAAVSTWLNGGVPPADVAEWAGHSVEILLKIYAKCLDGGTDLLRRRVERALAEPDEISGDERRTAGGTRDDGGGEPPQPDEPGES